MNLIEWWIDRPAWLRWLVTLIPGLIVLLVYLEHDGIMLGLLGVFVILCLANLVITGDKEPF